MLSFHKLKYFALLVLAAAACAVSSGSSAQVTGTDKFISIGTAGLTGVYYPAGGAICRLVNRGRKEHGVRCNSESTSGSVYNLNALKQNQIELGIAQTDWVYSSYKGLDSFADIGANTELRTIFLLHSEPFTVIVRKDSNIKSFNDIKGRKVNVGTPGSGVRGTMEKLMRKKGWRMSDFKAATELKSNELPSALCSGKIDVVLFTSGHPNGLITDITNKCETNLLPVEGSDVEELIKEYPYYTKATIPAGMYNGNNSEIRTFGVKAALVSNASLPDEVVYQLVKAVFDNIEDFKTLHPVFANLEPSVMVKEAVAAPLHNGALKYFNEKGYITPEPNH